MSPEYALAASSEPKSNSLSITSLLLCVTVAGGAATCAAYAWDNKRARERAFAEYCSEDAEPELNEASLRAIAREGRESSENTDFFEDNFDLKVESKREGIKLEDRLANKRKRRGLPVATICSLALLILCVASIAVCSFIGPIRRAEVARIPLLRLTRVSVEQSLAEPVEEINSGESEEDEIFFDENLAEDEEEPSFRESRIEVPIAYRSKEVGPRRISEIQVGDRLPGENPKGTMGGASLSSFSNRIASIRCAMRRKTEPSAISSYCVPTTGLIRLNRRFVELPTVRFSTKSIFSYWTSCPLRRRKIANWKSG